MSENAVTGKFFCLRNRALLQTLQVQCSGDDSRGKVRLLSKSRKGTVSQKDRKFDLYSVEELKQKFSEAGLSMEGCLVPVRVTMLGRGAPNQFATISLSLPGDLPENGARDRTRKFRNCDRGNVDGPVEEIHRGVSTKKSPSSSKRKKTKSGRTTDSETGSQHVLVTGVSKKLSLSEETQTVSKSTESDKSANISTDDMDILSIFQSPTSRTVADPDQSTNCDKDGVVGRGGELNPVDVIHCASRPTVGYVVEGGFSHHVGRGVGVGFVTLLGLLALLELERNAVAAGGGSRQPLRTLVRGTTCVQYRAATLDIVV
jgi:hypothetical protein